jgi:hypothetical protein
MGLEKSSTGGETVISTSYALQQLERIMGMVGFPKGRESGSYVAEMRKALEFSRDERAAELAITEILREFKRCPSVADLLEAVATESLRNAPEERYVEPKCDCKRCQDFGYFGGNLPPHPYAGPWKWCDCYAATESRAAEPGLVDEANRVRSLLIDKFASTTFRGAKRKNGADPMTPLVDEIYGGEF